MHSSPLLCRGVAWAMIALYGLVVSGLPLPIAAPPVGSPAAKTLAGKDRSQPFPCMDKPCGCESAERCFSNCCCHTPAETLAWAKARGIEASVIESLARRVAASTPAAPPSGCCSSRPQKVKPSCCSSAEDDVDQAICSDYQSLAADPQPSADEPACEREPVESDADPAVIVAVVILRDMLACGGIIAQWASVGVSLPPPALVQCDIACPLVGVVTPRNADSLLFGGPPDLPPPRA